MFIFALDEEPQSLDETLRAIAAACPTAETASFPDAASALDAVRTGGRYPDAVFCGLAMEDGLDFAARLRESCPCAGIVFVTASRDYAVEAFRVHADGYILKPLTADRVREELDHLSAPHGGRPHGAGDDKRLRVQCFGRFEVFWQGEPVKFHRRQTKELFALLIDHEGASCTAEEISAALWEDECNLTAAKARIRKLVHDLRGCLRDLGQEEVLKRHSGEMSVRRDLVECDYYAYMEGRSGCRPFSASTWPNTVGRGRRKAGCTSAWTAA